MRFGGAESQRGRASGSKVVEFLVGVKVRGLEEHLLRLTRHQVLILHFNARLEPFDVVLLVAKLALSYRLLLHFILLLEIALSLQVEVLPVAAKAIGLCRKPWRVGAGLMIQESVRVAGFRAETSCRHQFYTNKRHSDLKL
jgi:hypothetical protein